MGVAMMVIGIIEYAATILKGMSGGAVAADAAIADALIKIVQSGMNAYTQHTGQPIDPSQLKPIDPVV